MTKAEWNLGLAWGMETRVDSENFFQHECCKVTPSPQQRQSVIIYIICVATIPQEMWQLLSCHSEFTSAVSGKGLWAIYWCLWKHSKVFCSPWKGTEEPFLFSSPNVTDGGGQSGFERWLCFTGKCNRVSLCNMHYTACTGNTVPPAVTWSNHITCHNVC